MCRNGKVINKMTLSEKASLTSGKNFWETMNIDKFEIPSIYLADGPHGIRKQVASPEKIGLNISLPSTCFPTFATMANSWDPELMEKMGACIGEEAVAEKVSVVLGPGNNIKRNPLCGRNFEYFSEDPFLSGKMAAGYVRGVQSQGVYACVKHFVCENQETKRMVIDTIVDERTLREIYLSGFNIAIKEGKAKAVMTSYGKINGAYANENYHLMTGVLRNDWGYKGLVISNWGGCNDRVKGLIVGEDLEMPTTCGESNKEIEDAVKSGLIKEKDLDNSCDRILSAIIDTTETFKEKPIKEINIDAHDEFAKECAEQSIVLLKNKNSILPLDPKQKVVVIGDFAANPKIQGSGSSTVNPTKTSSFMNCIEEYPINCIGYAQGFNRYGKKNKTMIKKACKLASEADIVLMFMGLDELSELDGLDRNDMRLPKNQLTLLDELILLNKKIIVILSCGSAVELNFSDQIYGLVHTYLAGQEGAKALLNIITGKVNPSGKLAESYPYVYEDCPSASNFANNPRDIQYREGIFVGYRYYSTTGVKVRYPFGFGLSYTSFEYSDLKVFKTGVRFKITNTGKIGGAEIAQLYVGLSESKIFRSKEELKGFCKVFLNPEETKEVSIKFDDKTFSFFNINNNDWEIEGGQYNIMIGASCEDIRLQGMLEIKGVSAEGIYKKEELPSYFSGNVKDVSVTEFEHLIRDKIPDGQQMFYKKNRIIVNLNTTVNELRYARGLFGRMFSRTVRFAIWFCIATHQRAKSNELIMGLLNDPMRNLSRTSNGMISWGQLEGLMLIFNGHFFKGERKFIKEMKRKKHTIRQYKSSI
jgi:beta-glucosidase